ncbi:hypothetical protein [Leptothermofonsia sp. ETS-13]|uniref:hypothetical protein n=1 Tax=Leptothermofonsia sp. ETS-13 TaxID=3035696 RepID=UPI003B9F0751
MQTSASGGSHQSSIARSVSQAQPSFSTNRPYSTLAEYCLLGVLVSLGVGALLYRQYRLWIFGRRVKTLERLWKLNIERKAL